MSKTVKVKAEVAPVAEHENVVVEPETQANGDNLGEQASSVELLNAQDFSVDKEDLEDEVDSDFFKITFPNGEIYEIEVGKIGVMLADKGIALADSEVSVTEEYLISLIDNVLCWPNFGIEGRTANYDYADNWLRATKEIQ